MTLENVMTIKEREKSNKEFKRFQAELKELSRDEKAQAYCILIGALSFGMTIEEYRKRIDNAIKFVNEEFKKEATHV